MHRNQPRTVGRITRGKGFIAAVLLSMISIDAWAEAPECDHTPEILLQYFSMNAAWGFHFQGVYLDTCGRIGKYTINANNFEGFAAFIPAAGVIEAFVFRGFAKKRVEDFSRPVRTLPTSEFERIKELLVLARQGELQELRSCGNDFGRDVLFAFEFTEGSEVYRVRTLKEEGDFCMDNSSAEAGDLLQIMRDEAED